MKSLTGAMMIFSIALPLEVMGEGSNFNFFHNPGFEENFVLTIGKWYPSLREAGAELPAGETMEMPAGVLLLPALGWDHANGSRFEYVRGKAGQEVHSGEYAIRVISPNGAGLMVGAGWPISDDKERGVRGELFQVSNGEDLENYLIERGKKYAVDFYAKGAGAVSIQLYSFNKKNDWMGGKKDSQGQVMVMINDNDKDTPFPVGSSWTQYHGSLQILSEEVKAFRFVVWIKGDVSLDDISLTPISPGIPAAR